MDEQAKRRPHRKKPQEEYMRPNKPGHKYGRKPIFSTEREANMHRFLIDCWRLRIPRTENQFKMDIQFLVYSENMVVPFKNGVPGPYWVERFAALENGGQMEFPDESKVSEVLDEKIDLKQFLSESRLFIVDKNKGNLLDDPKRMLFIEVTVFSVNANLDITLVMLYNANGDILAPVIVHNNSIEQDILELYDNCIYFYETANGHIDSVTLEKLMSLISSHADDSAVVKPIVIYMDNILSAYFTFVTWETCEKEQVIPQCLPKSITEIYHSMNVGVSTSVVPKIIHSLTTRYTAFNRQCTSTIFMHLLREHTKNLKMKKALIDGLKSFSILQLIDVPKQPRKPRKRKIGTSDVQVQFNAETNLDAKSVLYTKHLIIQIL